MNVEIKKYDWVDALRGYAILLVMMVHTGQIFLGESFHLSKITSIGDLGVTLFFIISCFTLFNSYKSRSVSDGERKDKFFFIRRFFRIAPLYYVAIFFYVLIVIFYHTRWISPPLSWVKIFANFTFLNGIYLPAINYLPPGGWSVGDEMLFYLTIPFLFSKIKSTQSAFWLLIGTIISSFIIQIILYFLITRYTHHNWVDLRGWSFYFWFPNQFPVFCFGILLFFIIKNDKIKYSEWMLVLSLLLIVILSTINYKLTFPLFLIQREYLYSAAFCLFAFAVSKTKFKIFIKPVNKLGKVSFSMYLMHFFIIEIVFKICKVVFKGDFNKDIEFVIAYFLVMVITYLLSKLSYVYIERPGILRGEAIIESIKLKDQPENVTAINN